MTGTKKIQISGKNGIVLLILCWFFLNHGVPVNNTLLVYMILISESN